MFLLDEIQTQKNCVKFKKFKQVKIKYKKKSKQNTKVKFESKKTKINTFQIFIYYGKTEINKIYKNKLKCVELNLTRKH